MKFTINRLKPGEVVSAEVVETVSNGELIVNFNGDLIRVANESQRKFAPKQSLQLRVMTVSPLSFQLVPEKPNRQALDINA